MPEWNGAKEWGVRRGAEAVKNLPYFDAVLRERPFIAGESFSMADISLFAGHAFASAIGLPIAPELTRLAAWQERVAITRGEKPQRSDIAT